ncbi:hypothetical protein ACP4OV_013375 [Aristida adscensionis]
MTQRDMGSFYTNVVMQHPKTSSSTNILSNDYICTKDEDEVIKKLIKMKKTGNIDEVLVYFKEHAVTITRKDMECLFNRNGKKAYLNDLGMEDMVSTYLATDMVFLPINIANRHSYLAVLNAKKGIVQILDSLGAKPARGELDKVM